MIYTHLTSSRTYPNLPGVERLQHQYSPMQRMHPLFHILRHFCRDFYASGRALVSSSLAICSRRALVTCARGPMYFFLSLPPTCR